MKLSFKTGECQWARCAGRPRAGASRPVVAAAHDDRRQDL